MRGLDTDDTERPGIDRRTLIKRAAATGAVAWTAPLIVDSLASPAAALTCGTCFRVTFPADNAGSCNANSVAVTSAGSCAPTSGDCLGTTDLPGNTQYSAVCITPPGFCASTSNIFTFTLDATNPTCFTAGACAPTRRFLRARALFSPSGTCQDALINTAGTTAQFANRPVINGVQQTWANFTFVIGCGCL